MYRKYEINEDFFDEINTQEKAYFLGILFADGYNNYDKSNIRLSLQEGDIQILNDLKALLYKNNDKPLGRSKKENCNDLLYLDLTNKHISNKLKELGMIQNKTFLITFPEIPHNLYNHFIRGYMDGDGCINYFLLKGKHFKCQLRMLGTLEFLQKVQSIINENSNTTGSIRKRGNIYELAYSSRNQVIKACSYIYSDSVIFLERKFNKYLEIKNYKNGRYK